MFGVVFLWDKRNRYSIAPLIGSLEDFDWFKIEIVKEEDFLSLREHFLKKFNKVVYIFSFDTLHFIDFLERYGFIEKESEELFIAGGPHGSGSPLSILEAGFDVAVYGEGEEVLPELVFNFFKGKSIDGVKSIFIKKDGKLFFTGRRRDLDINLYKPFSIKYNFFVPIEIMRGCPNHCFYCQTPYFKGKVRWRSIEYILHFTEIVLRNGIRDIRFISPNAFNYPYGLDILLENLWKLIKSYGGRLFYGSFPSEVRPDWVNVENMSLLWNYTDTRRIVIGAQTGSERLLKLINRGHSVDDIINAVQISIDWGFEVDVDFIMGLPFEKVEDIERTVEIMEQIINLGGRIHLHTFMPLPQTPFASEKAGDIHPLYLEFINRYIGKGKIFGEWERQKIKALKFEKLLN